MKISIQTTVESNIDKVWSAWTAPVDINQWNAASDDWRKSRSINDLLVEGRFSYRMKTKDGIMGFDFEEIYLNAVPNRLVEYVLKDGQTVSINFGANR